jgi:hypothetical protein
MSLDKRVSKLIPTGSSLGLLVDTSLESGDDTLENVVEGLPDQVDENPPEYDDEVLGWASSKEKIESVSKTASYRSPSSMEKTNSVSKTAS